MSQNKTAALLLKILQYNQLQLQSMSLQTETLE